MKFRQNKWKLIALFSTLPLIFLFQNMTLEENQELELMRTIQFLDNKIKNTSATIAIQNERRQFKYILARKLSKIVKAKNCAQLKNIVPSLESGIYQIWNNVDHPSANLVDCIFDSQGRIIEEKIVVNGKEQARRFLGENNEASYVYTVKLSGNGSSQAVRKELKGILHISNIAPLTDTDMNKPLCPDGSFGFDENGLWVKYNCRGQFQLIMANGVRFLDAMEPDGLEPIYGSINNIRILKGGKLNINGWACQEKNKNSIEAQLYFGDAGEGGQFVSAQWAEKNVNSLQQTKCEGDGIVHGFHFTVNLNEKLLKNIDQVQKVKNWLEKPTTPFVYAYGVSHGPQGFSLKKLDGVATPLVEVDAKAKVEAITLLNNLYNKYEQELHVNTALVYNTNGFLDSAKVESGQLVLRGWVCEIGVKQSMPVIIYQGVRGSGGFPLGHVMADITHEPAVTAACSTSGIGHRFIARFPMYAKLISGAPLFAFAISNRFENSLFQLKRSTAINVPVLPLIGGVSSVVTAGRDVLINGWACLKNQSLPISVHAYVDGPYLTGKYLAQGVSNINGGPDMLNVCTSGSIAHRYSLRLPTSLWVDHAGKPVFIHGISGKAGVSNFLLTHSGSHKIPANSLNLQNVIGYLDTVEVVPQGVLVNGWACQVGDTRNLNVHIYAGGGLGTGRLVASGTANINHEEAVNTRCLGGTGHRFRITVPTTAQFKYGEAIHAFGISVISGKPNAELIGSGKTIYTPMVKWNYGAHTYILKMDVRTVVNGVTKDHLNCVNSTQLNGRLNYSFNGVCGSGQFIKPQTANKVRVCATKTNWSTGVLCSPFVNLTATTNLVIPGIEIPEQRSGSDR